MLARHAVLPVALALCAPASLAVWQWLDSQQVDPNASLITVADSDVVTNAMRPASADARSIEISQRNATERNIVDESNETSHRVRPDPMETVSGASLADRYGELLPGHTGEDLQEVLQLLLAASREDLHALFRGEGTLHDTLLEKIAVELGQEEAAFLMQLLSNAAHWPTVKAMILERELQTGQDYRGVMLTMGLSTGQIAVDDLLSLINTGLSMPEGALHLLALHGRAEDIASLAFRAPFPDLNARDPVARNTAVGALIQHYGMTPDPDPASAVEALRTLVDLGIDTRQAEGELDILSHIILHTRPWNQQAMGAMAAYVVQSGIVATPEQMTLWNQVATPADQENLRRGFDQYR